jgi:phosphoribosyl 1,2-cyclic phosphate phosphodiesterase
MICTLLGTGTSQGVPVIGCCCPVCTSDDPKDNRLRQSALISDGDTKILIDAGPDFRQQMLRERVDHLDAILLTHEHNDHVIGIDDVRPFNFRTGQPMKVYALPRVAKDLRDRFSYVFREPIPGLPRLELIEIDENTPPWKIGTIEVQPIGVQHGRLPILGFRFDKLVYLTDVKTMLPTETAKIIGCQHLIINALQKYPHPTHMNLEECLLYVEMINPEQAWLIHVSHLMGLSKDIAGELPPGVSFAYDGLQIKC